jgi:hypothetical protein
VDEQSRLSRPYGFGEISEVVAGILQTLRPPLFSIQLFQAGLQLPVALNNFASKVLLPFNNEIARWFE